MRYTEPLYPVCIHVSGSDDNSNQSSLADSSPIKQETSPGTSPAPEPMAVSQGDSNEDKSDRSQSPSRDRPGTDGKGGQSKRGPAENAVMRGPVRPGPGGCFRGVQRA